MFKIRKANRIKAIVIKFRQLNISDEERHTIQASVTGKTSLTDMSLIELEAVLHHLDKIAGGQNPADEWKFVFRLTPERQVYAKKIFRLAQKIGARQTPPVPVMTKDYIEGIAKRMAGNVDTLLEFCDAARLHQIVQALEVHIKRVSHG